MTLFIFLYVIPLIICLAAGAYTPYQKVLMWWIVCITPGLNLFYVLVVFGSMAKRMLAKFVTRRL